MPSIINVAVIGAGTQGRAFALLCARAGFKVILEDVMPERLRRAAGEFVSLGAEVVLASTVEEAVRDADVVVDFVPDELESKLEILSLVDRMAPPYTVICTPSETLSITDLASCTYRPDRCVMLRGLLVAGGAGHLFTTTRTAPDVVEGVMGFLGKLGLLFASAYDQDLPMLLKNMHASIL